MLNLKSLSEALGNNAVDKMLMDPPELTFKEEELSRGYCGNSLSIKMKKSAKKAVLGDMEAAAVVKSANERLAIVCGKRPLLTDSDNASDMKALKAE
eukprot:1240620-Prymnesium_polylepis.1